MVRIVAQGLLPTSADRLLLGRLGVDRIRLLPSVCGSEGAELLLQLPFVVRDLALQEVVLLQALLEVEQMLVALRLLGFGGQLRLRQVLQANRDSPRNVYSGPDRNYRNQRS